jgi:hypothetical protein
VRALEIQQRLCFASNQFERKKKEKNPYIQTLISKCDRGDIWDNIIGILGT